MTEVVANVNEEKKAVETPATPTESEVETKPAADTSKPAEEKPAEETKKADAAGEAKLADEAKPAESLKRPAHPFPGPHDQKRRKIQPLNIEKDVGLMVTCTNRIALKEGTRDLFHMIRKVRPDREKEQFDIVFDKNMPMGCAFVRATSPKTPSEIVTGVLQLVLEGEAKSAHIGRLLPLDYLCKPTLEDFKALAEKVIKPVFEKAVADIKGENTGDVKTWALQFKARGIKTVSKDMILQVVDQWSDGLPVSLEKPDVTINIELNKIFCGVSLLRNWHKYKKYNIESIQNPEKAKEEAEKQRKQNLDKKQEEEVKKGGTQVKFEDE